MRINRIKDNDIANGFGITMSLWTQGCPHHCKGCFNKETWNFTDGEEFTEENLNYIIDNIDKHNVKRDLSILGGEPLCDENIEGVLQVCQTFKEKYPQKKIYIWTGYTYQELLNGDADEEEDLTEKILSKIDYLIDGRFEENLKCKNMPLRGSSNQDLYRNTHSSNSLSESFEKIES